MKRGMPDPIFFYKQMITSPYSNTAYYDPHFEKWKEWFAWYPVKKYKWVEKQGNVPKHTEYSWVWGKVVLRRKVVDWIDGPGRESAGQATYWEYTTLLDMLKHGH